MITLPSSLAQFTLNRQHRFATCWKIVRTDATVILVTDHNGALTLSDGLTYSPVDGFSGSAREKKVGLDDTNMEFVGIISSSVIDDDDLRAGLYDGAEITEYHVEWRYPWIGNFDETTWWIDDIEWDGQRWQANITGSTRWLRKETGRYISRNCRHDLGDQFRGEVTIGCNVDTDAQTVTGKAPVVIDVIRQSFESDVSAQVDDFYQFGFIEWTTGDNADASIVSEVQRYENSNSKFYLVLETPYDISTSDRFSVRPGCGKIRDHCKGTDGASGKPWTNSIVDFGGEPDVPGLDRMMRIPNAKTS